MRKQAGFTLIELVMVIVILGILSAVALPKFVDLGSDARKSAMKAVEGSMRSTNAIVYAKAAVANQMGATGSVSIAGTAVTTAYGFATNVAQLRLAMDLASDFALATGTGADTAAIQHAGASDIATCKVVYGPATAANAPATYSPTLTGC